MVFDPQISADMSRRGYFKSTDSIVSHIGTICKHIFAAYLCGILENCPCNAAHQSVIFYLGGK